MNPQFWQGKRVLVTGHTGFKGAWLSLLLQRLGATVSGYALEPPTDPSLFQLCRLDQSMRSIVGDIRDARAVARTVDETQPEIVIHMAAQALVRRSYCDPVETFSTNVMGTVHLLDAVRHGPSVRAVVVVTSDKCYENREWPWAYRENEPFGGHDPYSASKACTELVAAAYRKSFFSADGESGDSPLIASARAGNVIGGGDWAADRLIPDCMRAMMSGQTIRIRNPKSIRPWQFVLEPLGGYLLLAERLCCEGRDFAEGWNFSPDDSEAKPVEWIVPRVIAAWGPSANWSLDGGVHPHEAYFLKLDASKARARLGWRPRTNLAQALQRTTQWYKRYHAGEDPRAVTLEQINEFLDVQDCP